MINGPKPLSDQPPALKVIKTPRFADGITVAELRKQSLPVQKETMTVWFLAHHVPATETYFGFGEAAPQSGKS